MISGVHIEVVLAAAYALFLVGVAAALEWLARHSHRRAEHSRNTGFIYRHRLDVWECPTGHHLKRAETDLERRVARYRAEARVCNTCHCKPDCTDADDGRVLESRPAERGWVQLELRRFHRGISLSLLLLAVLILAAEMVRYPEFRDWLVLLVLLIPIGATGSLHFVSLWDPARRN
jgi:hypothetical protein